MLIRSSSSSIHFQDNIASMQERLSTSGGFLASRRVDRGGNVGVVINGNGRGEEEEEQEQEEEDGNSVAESLTSEKDRQDLEVAMIDIEGKKQRQMGGRGFARKSSEGFGHQMTASAPPAMAFPRRRASTDYRSAKEMGSLKMQLAELQTLVDAYERTSTPRNNRFALSAAAGGVAADTGSTISDMSFTESRHHRMKGADNLLTEMSEQLQLQKELHLRRKDLEKLMKKDMMENIQKEHAEADDEDEMTRTSSDVRSEESLGTGSRHPRRRRRGGGGGGGGSDGVNARLSAGSLGAWLNSNLVPANVPRRLRQRSVSSKNSLSGFALEPASAAAAAQIQVLQRQVDKLQMEIGILNQTATLRQQRRMNGGGGADFLESASSMAALANNHLRQPPSEDDVRLQLLQHQIQLLTQSLSQCYQTVLSVQQDVGMLQCTVEKLIQNQQELAQQQQQQQQRSQQQQVSNSSSAIGIGQPQQQSGNAPQQQQQENSPSARQSQPSMQVDNLNRGRGFDTWQACNVGDQEFVPILPMPAAAITTTNAEQQQLRHHHHQTQSLSFAASASDDVATAAAFPEAILGSIEANNAQWIGASQPQETLAIVSHPPPPPAASARG